MKLRFEALKYLPDRVHGRPRRDVNLSGSVGLAELLDGIGDD